MKLTRQHKTGILVLLGTGLLIIGISYLKGHGFFKGDNNYSAYYSNVEGLTEATPLYLNGFKIGQVVNTDMMHEGDNAGQIAVTYLVTEERLFIPEDSEIQIYSADLFTKAARLKPGESETRAEKGAVLKGTKAMSLTETFNQELDPIKKRAETLMASVDTVLAAFQNIMDEGTQSDIAMSFSTIRTSLEAFSRTAVRLDQLIQRESPAIENSLDNFADISDTLNKHSKDMGRIMSNMAAITDTLANGGISDIMSSLNQTTVRLQSIIKKIDDGEGSLGLLTNDDSLYINMNRAAEELAVLLDDFEKHPERYVQVSVFGRKNKKPALSDKDIQDIKERIDCCPK